MVIGAIAGVWAVATQLTPSQFINVMVVGAILFLIPSLVVQAKRWHDLGLPAWLCFLSVVPYLGLVVLITVGLIPGSVGQNKYGPDPIARTAS